MNSYISHLECSGCGVHYGFDQLHTFCPACKSALLARYDLKSARGQVDREVVTRRKKGMWRWNELLPVINPENQISLGEGDTALLAVPQLGKELGLLNLFVKDESSNPTGSFKARGLAAAISKAKELGVQKVIIPTAGNAGGAWRLMLHVQVCKRISSCLGIRHTLTWRKAGSWVRRWRL